MRVQMKGGKAPRQYLLTVALFSSAGEKQKSSLGSHRVLAHRAFFIETCERNVITNYARRDDRSETPAYLHDSFTRFGIAYFS